MMSLEEELKIRHDCRPGLSLADFEFGSVHQLFRRQASRTPNLPAIEGTGEYVLTYRELDFMSDLMARDLGLRLSGVAPYPLNTGLVMDCGVVVGIMLERSPAIVAAVLSCWKAGFAVVLVDPNQPKSRNGHIIEDCGCSLLIVDKSQRENAASWEALTWHYAGRTRASRSLLFFNPISSASGTAIWTILTNGGCLFIPPQDEITSDLANCINRYRIDDMCITPSSISLINPSQVPSLKTVSLVGEAASCTVTGTWSPYVSLRIGYGATEMNSHCLPFHDEPTGTLPPYHSLPSSDYSLYILRPGTIELCPLYTPGEICLSSTWMSSGYINRPGATSQVFLPHPFPGDAGHTYIYRTGDLGIFVGDQAFVLLGRVDFQFKIDGNRVQPEEVEYIISQIPHVIRCRVILIEPSVRRPVITCCVVLTDILTADIDADSFWADFICKAEVACSDHLPAYMKPHRWLRFKKFPETATAKTDTAALTRAAKSLIDSGSLVMTDGYLQKDSKFILGNGRIFLDLATEILAGSDCDAISLEDSQSIQARSFIENGGTSLLSLQLRAQLRKREIDLPMATLYSTRSLADVALTLSAKEEDAFESILIKSVKPVPSATNGLLRRMALDTECGSESFEAVFPSTILQREMFVTSILEPKSWMFYQFFDLSQSDCTEAQLLEGIRLLVSKKQNLRTVFSLLDVSVNPKTIETPDSAFDLIKNAEFVQAVLKPSELKIDLSQDTEIVDPDIHRIRDSMRPWSFLRPLWRVAFLSNPRLLAWTFHHSIVDAWVARNIAEDLHAILASIIQRDSCQGGWQRFLTEACENAARPSMEQWALKTYGVDGLGSSPDSVLQKHMRIWEDFMTGARATPIPDEGKLPPQALPAPPLFKRIDSLPYGAWCRSHHITPAALIHAATSLTIARVLKWWRPGGPQEMPEEVVYYRLSANRADIEDASEMEGALISISPIRVPVPAEADIVDISRRAFSNWLTTQESDPYYQDGYLVATGPEATARQRRWGNVLLNHIVNQKEERQSAAALRGVVEDRCGYAMVWPFAALEMTVVETDSSKADSLQLCILSTLNQRDTEEFMDIFARILEGAYDVQQSLPNQREN
ncbi:hypothetical protein CABS01_11794 [Colletotrichum abscissum]|nr:uncharacterized protein CABS01_11794 [Colletotrichum abscissum]KAK1492897.1 hypothetical protein CABS01_11794 [Colletotrichum abscissum]